MPCPHNPTPANADFLSFASGFGSTDTHRDLNGNGRVDFPDFPVSATQFYSEEQSSMPDQGAAEAAVSGFDQRVDAIGEGVEIGSHG